MYCKRCGTSLEADMLFCPECGNRIASPVMGSDEKPAAEAAAQEPPPERLFDYRAAPDAATRVFEPRERLDGDPDLSFIAAQLEMMDKPAPAESPEPTAPLRPLSQRAGREGYVRPAAPLQRTAAPSATTAPRRPEPLNDGYTQEANVREGKYRRTSAGKRVASICLCVFLACVLLFTIIDVALRLTLTEDNIRDAASYDKMTEKTLLTDAGEMSAVEYLREMIGTEVVAAYQITDAQLKEALRSGGLAELVADILGDYAAYFFNNQEPRCLNAGYVVAAFQQMNSSVSAVAGDEITVYDTDTLTEEVNGGSLSFLSIDSDGGYFQKAYGVNPKLPATVFSLMVLIICGVIVVLALVMVFVINSANIPAGMRFNGVTLIIDGGLCLMSALGALILSLVKSSLWIAADLLLKLALYLGAVSLGVMVIGVVLVVIARALRKKERAADKAAADLID